MKDKILRGWRYFKKNGFVKTVKRLFLGLKIKLFGQKKQPEPQEYPVGPDEVELQRQRETVFPEPPFISVVVPLYNTELSYLEEMVNSVRTQTYSRWELCLADASDSNHAQVGEYCLSVACKDSRIRYRHLEKNLGISGNSNQAAEMARGDYIALLDHDDTYTPDALFEIAQAVVQFHPDVIYTDEDKISIEGKRYHPFYKPDWSPDLLYSQMYICHLLVFTKELFFAVGGFDEKASGSQDYDLMLRLSEQTKQIYHIPKVLYSWRETPSSTSINPNSKPYAHMAGLNALDAHLKRRYQGRAHAEETEYTYVYRARFHTLEKNPKVSVIIPTKDHPELLQNCVESILQKTNYPNYEILVLDNNSEEEKTFQLFKTLAQNERISVIPAKFDFNWSKLNNFGMQHATGDVFIFLNNDTQIISPDWMTFLAENALREEIGVVGALLLYEDGTIQHSGVVVGMGGWADHVYKGEKPVHYAPVFISPVINRNVLAVTGACMAISRATIKKIGQFNEDFIICGSDVEICLRAYHAGLYNLLCADARLYHLESKSRDAYIPEIDFTLSKKFYAPYREGEDPFYNPNLDKFSCVPRERSLK